MVAVPAWFRAQPGARWGSRLHPLHRQRRAHPRQPDHQPALGAVGVRDRLGRGAEKLRHDLQRLPGLPPLGAADERRRRRRRRAARVAWRSAPTSSPRSSGTRCAATEPRSFPTPGRCSTEIAEAPPQPGEQHHPVRLFIGAGMPSGLWRRVTDRFAPARVLEFYASTEGDAVLVNVTGQKPGSKGRPLPGSAEVRIASYDPIARRLVEGRDGFAVACARHETGMLLAQVRRDGSRTGDGVLRGVFESGDAWLETGGPVPPRRRRRLLARRPRSGIDPDGHRGSSSPGRSRDALAGIEAVRLARSPTGSRAATEAPRFPARR